VRLKQEKKDGRERERERGEGGREREHYCDDLRF
jgi:hypothetical protein